jgi:hypothetical protein
VAVSVGVGVALILAAWPLGFLAGAWEMRRALGRQVDRLLCVCEALVAAAKDRETGARREGRERTADLEDQSSEAMRRAHAARSPG